ncbi:MAG: PDZ domain-containing protein [Planctomycetes bacterium]|nr:PDZ domain-containing protein [Planctomycetota bacterium]
MLRETLHGLLGALIALSVAAGAASAGGPPTCFQGAEAPEAVIPVLERLGSEVRSAAERAKEVLAHVELKLDAETNLHTAGVVVEPAERLVALPFHPAFRSRDRAYVRLLGTRRACLAYVIGANESRTAVFVRLQIDADSQLALAPLDLAPEESSSSGSFAIAVAPTSALDVRGQPELARWTVNLSAVGQTRRGRTGLIVLQQDLGPAAHGGVLVDPRGRAIAFLPDLEVVGEGEEAQDGGERASEERMRGMNSREPAITCAIPLARLRAEALEAQREFSRTHGQPPAWPSQPWIGIYVWRPELGASGGPSAFEPFQILAVFESSPAQRAGLREGDVLTALDDIPLRNSADFMAGLRKLPSQPPHLLRMSVRRSGRTLGLTAELNPEVATDAPGSAESPNPKKKEGE